MKYPFVDTPMNRKLETLIDQCSDPGMIITREMGKFIFHVIPNASITEISSGDDWDIDITYISAHIAVINKEEGTWGLGQFRDPLSHLGRPAPDFVSLKPLLKAIEEGNLEEVYRQAPVVVNIDMGTGDNLTYLDHYQHLKEKGGSEAYEKHINWLIENGHKKAGSMDGPKAIEAEVENTKRLWGGQKTKEGEPASGFRLLTRYSSYSSIPEMMRNEFREDSLVRMMGYTRDPDMHAENQDVGKTLGNRYSPGGHPELALDAPLDSYYKTVDQMYEGIKRSYQESASLFKERVIDSYKEVLSNRFISMKGDMSEAEIRSLIDRIGDLLDKDVSLAKGLIGDTPQSTRNKSQILDYFDGNERIFSSFMRDEKIKRGIEKGLPMKDTLSHLPLLNTSKRTINAYLANFKNYLSYEGEPIELTTEKGVSTMTKMNFMGASSLGNNMHDVIALITTLPEKHLIDEDRNADRMVEVLAGFPVIVDTLRHRCIDARDNGASLKDLMSWVSGEIDNMQKRPQTLRDAETIFKENYFSTVVHHLGHLNNLDVGDDPYLVNEQPVRLKARGVVDSLCESGEYRSVLAFDDAIHRDIHQLFKHGKPDANIEWGRTIDEDFEFNGYRISPITNNADLSQEGMELNHCVGTYLSAILENQSYIFSVTKDDKRFSTIEIKETFGGDDDFEIIQHYAYGNSTPPEDAIEAAEDFLEAINEQDIAFDREPCESDLIDESFQEGMEVEREEVEFGLRFSDRDFVLYAIDSMQRILPSFDVWDALEKEGVPGSQIEDLRRDYEVDYGAERNQEKACPPGG